ncbi:hypothetical protein Tsubulata_015045 [Turnera subulata]|uniref:Pseudouridine synthase RsuA/RluA-like domain-containing protein n=1 Tax=Turnera subulata TaxID=218843 RepID=A0A9Q0G9B8_9ROSI|nr:hypothetical protein Tsubulata_015045 [Turnera subulata]
MTPWKWNKIYKPEQQQGLSSSLLSLLRIRSYSRVAPPSSAAAAVIRVSNNVARLGPPKDPPKPRQLLSLPPFPGLPLPGKNTLYDRITAITWLRYYFDEVPDSAIQYHFNKGLVQMEESSSCRDYSPTQGLIKPMRKVKPGDVIEVGARMYVPVSIAESRVSRRFDTIPSATLYPNADEIKYLQRLVKYKAGSNVLFPLCSSMANILMFYCWLLIFQDSAILVLNKPPKLPVKGNMPVHNSMDALAAAALCYDYDEAPKLVHRLDRESSGLLLMGRTKKSVDYLHKLFSDVERAKPKPQGWRDACESVYQRYWALVIGSPKAKEGIIEAPLSKVLLDDGKTDRVVLSQCSGFEASQEAFTEYRVLGPIINGCSWIELRPLTSCKHQLRVHCAEALGTPIVGDYKYGWFVHRRWKQMPQVDIEPSSGKPYKLRRPEGLDIQKGSVLSKVPLLHLHCREILLPNIAKLDYLSDQKPENIGNAVGSKQDFLRFVAPMPNHMKISWNLMSSYLV